VTIELRTASADDWRAWRSVRLAALTDAPAAFCSRLEEWADAPEGRWRERLSIPGAIDLLAFDADGIAPVGMATGTPGGDHGSCAELISLWVDPTVRGRGVAIALTTAIAGWAASTGATMLTLSGALTRVQEHGLRPIATDLGSIDVCAGIDQLDDFGGVALHGCIVQWRPVHPIIHRATSASRKFMLAGLGSERRRALGIAVQAA
jgi:GNAT superfamily N-acetyltransferase